MTQQALMAALALGATAAPIQGQAQLATQRPTIVLVHGGFVDGSGWEGTRAANSSTAGRVLVPR